MKYERMINSEQETKALAEQLAALLHAGDVLTLEGDLGAGKTTFTKVWRKGWVLHAT